MARIIPLTLFAACVALSAQTPVAGREAVVQLLRTFDRMARSDLWPGFRPDTMPLAIFDRTHTWLVRHRAPPPSFRRDRDGLWVMDGRQQDVTANSSARIAGQSTATLLPAFSASPPKRWASVLAHETFHVFQRSKHPSWAANEADLFTYPLENAGALAERRLEFTALKRALEAKNTRETKCWAAVALHERAERFARLGRSPATYERKGELNEGLAQYVESRAAGERAASIMPDTEYAIDGIRDRIYKSGLAIGQLLDRLDKEWRRPFDRADSSASLDGTLTNAIGSAPTRCAFTADESEREMGRARSDSAAYQARLTSLEQEVMNRAGWRVEVVAEGQPFQVAGFDPLNVSRLTPTRVLHRRFLKVSGRNASLEVFGRDALTEAAGPHPLFAGIRTITITGIESAPMVRDSAGATVIDARGVQARLAGARVDTMGTRLVIRVPQ